MAMVMLLLLGYRIVLFWVGAMTSMTEEVRGRIFLGALFLNGGKMIGRTKREMENGGKKGWRPDTESSHHQKQPNHSHTARTHRPSTMHTIESMIERRHKAV
jgi:hypothetical protein